MRVVAMFRVSTEQQAEQGASLDAQERHYRQLAQRERWETVATFRGCESATQAAKERDVLQQVLACIRAEKPDAVYIHEQSRLTRGDELDAALLFRELREQRTKVIIGGVVRDLESIDERFMLGIQSLVDRTESERIRERMDRGKREKARQGRRGSGFAPYGYHNPLRGDPEHGKLKMVLEEVAVVRRIFELAAKGLSTLSIARTLNAESVRAPRGGTWGKTTIRRILDNPSYLGVLASFAWKPMRKGSRCYKLDLGSTDAIIVPDAHEAIIDRELWDAVHALPKVRQTKRAYMLTGLLHVDGRRLACDSSRGRSFYRSRDGRGPGPWLPAKETEDAIWKAFVSLTTGPEFVASMIKTAQRRQPLQELNEQIRRQEKQVPRLRRRLDRLIDMRADGEISKDVFQHKSREAEEALKSAEEILRELRRRIASTDSSQAERVVKAIRLLIGDPRRLSVKEKKNLLHAMVNRIDIQAERVIRTQSRNSKGSFGPGPHAKWIVRDITFELQLPGDDRSRGVDTSCS
ncbi:MAG: recombinase family protein [Phycisphaerales bacterium]|nr:recombinase family protein [Phycisphaerales bacterium]